MMSGFIQHGFFQEALQNFRQMQALGIQPGGEILGSLVDACAHMGAFHLGKEIHGYLIKNFFPKSAEERYLSLTTSILNMYVRSGSISSAREVFSRMETRDIVAWTSMIDGYGTHGLGTEAIELFNEMLEEGLVTPNAVTFLSLLSSCSHSGLVREGCELFVAAKHVYCIELSLDHYTCLVDLLGRSGKLKEALAMVLKLGVFSDSRIWGALVAAARTHDDRKVGEYAAEKVLELEPDSVGYYTLLSNVMAGVGEWNEAEEVRRVVHDQKQLNKEPGWSLVVGICGKDNHRFVAGDTSHVRIEEVCKVVRHLSRQIMK
ncbi:Pentatricopeptide repeat-containing protein At4g30700 [Linum perenne]